MQCENIAQTQTQKLRILSMASDDKLIDEKALRDRFLKEANLHGKDNQCKREQALRRASEVRDFEIGLYWRRSLYFWGFQVAFLAGAGVSVGSLNESPRELEPFFLVLVFSSHS